MIVFALAVSLLMLTPGPAVLMLVNIGVNFGFSKGIPFTIGVITGANLVAISVIFGLATIILSYPTLRLILLISSSIYLLYLTIRIFTQNPQKSLKQGAGKLRFLDGVALQIINPKNYIVQITLFSGFLIWDKYFFFEAITKLLIANLIWLPMHLLWLLLGAAVKEFEVTKKNRQLVNILMALLMLFFLILAIFNY